MEHKTLNSEQSIAIITRMLQNTQNNLQKNAGSYFLLWGYVTLITSLAVYAALVATGDWRFNYLWFAIPLAGLPLMFIVRRRIGQPPVRTFVDIAVWKLWIPLCVALLTFSFLAGGRAMSLVLLLLSIGVAQTGLIVKYRVFIAAGIIGFLAALSLLFIGGTGQILVFAFFCTVVLIIPGHILNRKAARHVQRA